MATRTLVTVPTRQNVNNLVFNSDFEYAPTFVGAANVVSRWIDGTAAGSSTNPDFGWYLSTSSGAPTAWSAQFDSAVSHSGSGSLKLNITTVSVNQDIDLTSSNVVRGGTAVRGPRLIPVLPSTSYTFSYWLKYTSISNNNAQGIRVRVQTQTGALANDSAALYSNGFLTGTADWTRFTGTFTTSANAKFAVIFMYLQGETGTAWIDDITFGPTTAIVRSTSGTRSAAVSRALT